ncbi:MAG: hypothetical protein ACLQVJ_23745 [Syntrophobacteraceae bacterium]
MQKLNYRKGKKMKRIMSALIVLAMVFTLVSISEAACDDIFATYSGNKGSMSLSDFQQYWNASSHKEQVSIGNASGGEAEIAFLMASGGSYQMSKSEFCHWQRHSYKGQH